MTERKELRYFVVLPSGQILPATESMTAHDATAKAMRMDIPPGCYVTERVADGVRENK